MTRLHAGPIVAAIFLALIVAGVCSYADARLSTPDPTPPAVVTVLPTLAPTPAVPGYARPDPTSTRVLPVTVTPERLPGLAGTSTPTTVPFVTVTPEPTPLPATPTRPPATMVQKGLAP